MAKKNFGIIIFVILVGVIIFMVYQPNKKQAYFGFKGFGNQNICLQDQQGESDSPNSLCVTKCINNLGNCGISTINSWLYYSSDLYDCPALWQNIDPDRLRCFYGELDSSDIVKGTVGSSSGGCTVITAQSYALCSSNSLYWYDNCNNKGNFKETCSNGCIDGDDDCNILTCNTPADTNCNNCIENPEFTTYKSRWLSFDIAVGNTEYTNAKSKWIIFDGC